MTHAEMNEMKALAAILDMGPDNDEWDRAYKRYFELVEKQQEEYKAENIGKLQEFYDEHIAGKTWEEIDPEAWDWYSDYHKDVFGYRPRSLAFGEYVPVH